MDSKKHVGFIVGNKREDPLDEVMIYTITDETKLEQCRVIAGMCKKAIFISLTTEYFYIYRNGEFKMVIPKHLNL